MSRSRKRLLLHLAFWIPLLGLAIGWRWWADRPRTESAEEAVATPVERRAATSEEWRRSIEELGRERLAKLLVWRPIDVRGRDRSAMPRGELVWWHDGEQERVAYLPAPGEDPATAAPALAYALDRGHAQLWNAHGDPRLRERLFELKPAYRLPPAWTLLRHPSLEGE